MASERVAQWIARWGDSDCLMEHYESLNSFLMSEVGLLEGELDEWCRLRGRGNIMFLREFCDRNCGREWADSLREDLKEWGLDISL